MVQNVVFVADNDVELTYLLTYLFLPLLSYYYYYYCHGRRSRGGGDKGTSPPPEFGAGDANANCFPLPDFVI